MAKKELSIGRIKTNVPENMISEDSSAMSLLPQNIMVKKYPTTSYMYDGVYDDSMAGIDRNINENHSGMKKSRVKGRR